MVPEFGEDGPIDLWSETQPTSRQNIRLYLTVYCMEANYIGYLRRTMPLAQQQYMAYGFVEVTRNQNQ